MDWTDSDSAQPDKNNNSAIEPDRNNNASRLKEPAISSNSPAQLQSGQVGEVTKQNDGSYIAEGLTEKGEKIYFSLIPVDTEKESNGIGRWSIFKKMCEKGSRVLLAIRDSEETPDLPEDFQNSIKVKMDYQEKNRKSYWAALDSLHTAMKGFRPNSGYVALVSKQPNFTPHSMPDFDNQPKKFEQAMDAYKDILMVITTKPIDQETYQNRGIFRTPYSMPDGGYSRISTQLHAFTAKAMSQETPSLNSMFVAPIRRMNNILANKIGNNNLKTGDQIPDSVLSKIDPYDIGMLDTPTLVPLEVLKGLHG